jgi:hypothetical protein
MTVGVTTVRALLVDKTTSNWRRGGDKCNMGVREIVENGGGVLERSETRVLYLMMFDGVVHPFW